MLFAVSLETSFYELNFYFWQFIEFVCCLLSLASHSIADWVCFAVYLDGIGFLGIKRRMTEFSSSCTKTLSYSTELKSSIRQITHFFWSNHDLFNASTGDCLIHPFLSKMMRDWNFWPY
jgi:hypothetical protein